MKTFKVGDRVNHSIQGMATVVCVNSEEDVLLRLDDASGLPYSDYSYRYKVANTEAGNWYWDPNVSRCALVHRKSTFKGSLK
jgi:hypothetical protein